MRRFHIHLPIPLLERLKARSVASGYSVAELVRQALEAFLA